jgi:hypothetical protein
MKIGKKKSIILKKILIFRTEQGKILNRPTLYINSNKGLTTSKKTAEAKLLSV